MNVFFEVFFVTISNKNQFFGLYKKKNIMKGSDLLKESEKNIVKT